MKREFLKFFLVAVATLSFAGEALAAVSPNAGADAHAAPTNAEVDQALKSLKVRSPERYRRIVEIRETEPERFLQNVLVVAREEERLARVKKQVPENYPLQIAMWNNREKLRALVVEYRAENDPAGREIIESQLDNLLGEQYELRRQMRLNRLKVAEKRLNAMRLALRQDHATEKTRFIAEWKPKLVPVGERPASVTSAAPLRPGKKTAKKSLATEEQFED